jgi:hypothetical protein
LRPQSSVVILTAALVLGGAGQASAQTAAPAAASTSTAPPAPHRKNRHFVPGTPLDTALSTRLWTDVPTMPGFVRETHRDPKTLDYTPLSGGLVPDPVDRPKPRDAANVQALQAELEQGITHNATRAKGLRSDPAKHASRQAKAAE